MSRKANVLYLLCIPVTGLVAMSFIQKGSVVQSMASDIYQQFVSSHKILTASQSLEVETVNRIGHRVISAAKKYHHLKKTDKELEGYNWEIGLFDERKEDAWCLPGGKIAVYSSLLPLTQSDGSLAVILSHEMAHIFLKHGDERMKKYLKEYLGGKDLSASLASKPVETKDFYRMAFGTGDYVGVIRGFSANDEFEADKLGSILCGMAGYDPQEAIVFWERMGHLNGTGRQPVLLSTHPVYDERVSKLKDIMDDISRDYYKPIGKN
jgi:predicted Zn-dependent protease